MDYTLIILAGGRGLRMGGVDKGLVDIDGHPLIEHLLLALPPARHCIISANRNLQRYQQWADQVVSDQRDGFAGPMAGLEAALAVTEGPCLCLPCDLPHPPARLAERLLHGLRPDAVNVLQDPQRVQPLCLGLIASPDWCRTLTDYLDNGGHSAHGWLERVAWQAVPFDQPLENLNHWPDT
ncbi:MAG: NTP transferase domain-containing protein [Alcanivorax sp.]|nr:NTP transferase domain-containing protein [Alcanivorax sp.]